MLLYLSLFIGFIVHGIQNPNYDGSSTKNFDTNPKTWGIEYNIGVCNDVSFTKTLEINVLGTTSEADLIMGFGTQHRFFGMYLGRKLYHIYSYIYIHIYIYVY